MNGCIQTAGEYDDVIAQLRHSIQVLSSRVQQYRSLLVARCSGDVNALANKCVQLSDTVRPAGGLFLPPPLFMGVKYSSAFVCMAVCLNNSIVIGGFS